MCRKFILYNPLAGLNGGKERAEVLRDLYSGQTLEYRDITKINDYVSFAAGLEPKDQIVVCGGDGTLSRFANDIYDLGISNDIFYYATGNGNDFMRDAGHAFGDPPFQVNEYIKDLPTVTVKGKTFHFLNAIGFGIDGYCCEVGDELREKNKKPNYTLIAIKGLLYGYKPTSAVVTVDGEERVYQKVWIAPTMFGRFYGGGMMPAPDQDRGDPEEKVSFCAIHDSGKLRTLTVFPSIFTGKHVEHTSMVEILSGYHVDVKFDRPAALQIDGETILDVTEYEVKSVQSAAPVAQRASAAAK